jgi:uncharacterized protein (DUF2141 family)
VARVLKVRGGAKGALGAWVLLVLGAAAFAQTPAPRDGVITGQVVDAVSGKPVSAAIVSIGGSSVPPREGPNGPIGPPRILTAADGRFMFRDLRDGSFTITATRSGYSFGAAGARRPNGEPQPVVLTAARRTVDITIRMWKLAAIAGTVVDEAGEPLVGLRVAALARSALFGRTQFVPAVPSTTTDDRGMYRFGNLEAADYIVVAAPPVFSAKQSALEDLGRSGRGSELAAAAMGAAWRTGLIAGDAYIPLMRGGAVPPPPGPKGRLQFYPTTLYPSAPSVAQASIITLASGEERTSIDIQLMPVPAVRVSGLLVAPNGSTDGMRVELVPARGDEIAGGLLTAMSVTDAAGAFVFAAVAPGMYSLRATRSSQGGGGSDLYWVDMPVAVGGDDIENIAAILVPPLRVTARSQFDGSAPRPATQTGRFTSVPFMLEAVDRLPGSPSGMAAISSVDGSFTLNGFMPGRYRVRVPDSPSGWMFKGAMLDGVDVSETPLDLKHDVSDLVLVFTDRWSGLSGTVQGAGADTATVIAFTTDMQAWAGPGTNRRRLRSARVNASGQFGISSLPPGDYYVVAIRDDDAAGWRDPAALEALARVAARVTILEGEHKTIDPRISEVRR